MRIDNQDIIRTAQQLRDEENQQLHVPAWNRHRSHLHIPAWLVAIPAAVFIGFILGNWTKTDSPSTTPLTALVDTVYIKVPDPQPSQDSVAQVIPDTQAPKSTQTARTTRHRPVQPTVGRPVADDHIRYDLLVKN